MSKQRIETPKNLEIEELLRKACQEWRAKNPSIDVNSRAGSFKNDKKLCIKITPKGDITSQDILLYIHKRYLTNKRSLNNISIIENENQIQIKSFTLLTLYRKLFLEETSTSKKGTKRRRKKITATSTSSRKKQQTKQTQESQGSEGKTQEPRGTKRKRPNSKEEVNSKNRSTNLDALLQSATEIELEESSTLRNQLDESKKKCAELQQNIALLQKNMEVANNNLRISQNIRIESLESIKNLSQEKRDLTIQLQEIQKKEAEANKKTKKLERKLKVKEKETLNLEEENKKACESIKRYELRYEENLKSCQERLSKYYEERLKAMQGELSKKEEKTNIQAREIENFQKETQEQQKKILNIEEEKEELRDQKEELGRINRTFIEEKEALQKEIEQLRENQKVFEFSALPVVSQGKARTQNRSPKKQKTTHLNNLSTPSITEIPQTTFSKAKNNRGTYRFRIQDGIVVTGSHNNLGNK